MICFIVLGIMYGFQHRWIGHAASQSSSASLGENKSPNASAENSNAFYENKDEASDGDVGPVKQGDSPQIFVTDLQHEDVVHHVDSEKSVQDTPGGEPTEEIIEENEQARLVKNDSVSKPPVRFESFVRPEPTRRCLGFHRGVPFWSQVCVPIYLTGCLFLLISCSCGVLIGVYANVQILGINVQIDLDTFSFANLISRSWEGQSYTLTILIALSTCVFPYARLLSLYYIWFVPPTWLKPATRGRFLEHIEYFGKWCLSIVFVKVEEKNPREMQKIAPKSCFFYQISSKFQFSFLLDRN